MFPLAEVCPYRGCPRHKSLRQDPSFVANDTYLSLVHVCAPPSHSDFNEILDSSWDTRGWTFQERLLSRRIVYFGKTQLLWEYQNSRWTEHNIDNFDMNQPARAISKAEEEGGLKSNIMGALARSVVMIMPDYKVHGNTFYCHAR